MGVCGDCQTYDFEQHAPDCGGYVAPAFSPGDCVCGHRMVHHAKNEHRREPLDGCHWFGCKCTCYSRSPGYGLPADLIAHGSPAVTRELAKLSLLAAFVGAAPGIVFRGEAQQLVERLGGGAYGIDVRSGHLDGVGASEAMRMIAKHALALLGDDSGR